MSVSVVIPVKDGARFVAEAVKSALDQPEVQEVVVVDDGSTDGSSEIVRAIGDQRVSVIEGPQRGVSAARNLGLATALRVRLLREARSWIVFLDADDRMRPGAVAALLGGVERDCVAVYGDYDRIDEQGKLIGRRRLLSNRHKPSGDILRRLVAGNFIVNGGVMLIRAEVFRRLGGFDETLRYCEDWHAFCKLAASGPIIWRPNANVLDYRVHRESAMMRGSIEFGQYQAALERVFSDRVVTARFDAVECAQLRREAEAHLRTYLACQTLRSRAYLRAVRQVVRAIGSLPSRTPRIMVRIIGAMAGL
jgi:glycosyltransferase involved in cell wall biosynthesis